MDPATSAGIPSPSSENSRTGAMVSLQHRSFELLVQTFPASMHPSGIRDALFAAIGEFKPEALD